MECLICGFSDKQRLVFPVISSKGIILVCSVCAAEEGFPRVKESQTGPEVPKTVYERLSIMAGIKPKIQEKKFEFGREERSAKQIVNKNYEEKVKRQPSIQQRHDLVDNFHWILMRIRRVKGLTQKQLAERIGETETAIKMAEQGIVPEGYRLLDKFENFFKVRIIKDRENFPGTQQTPFTNFHPSTHQPEAKAVEKVAEKLTVPKKIVFDKETLNSLTISDLKRMKEEKEKAKLGFDEDGFGNK